MIKINIKQGTSDWELIRCGKVTSTRFSQLMMGEKTKGYQDLIKDIVGEIITNEKEETYTNAIMERGIELEPTAIKEYETIFGIELERIGFLLPDEDNEFFDWIGVSPDAMQLEIKCPLRKTHLSYIKADKLPTEYKHQVQGQLFVSGCEYWDFMSFYPNMKPFIIRVLPDLELHKQYVIELRNLIENVNIELLNYKNYNPI